MSSAGHVADMIARIKANREIAKRRNPFKKKDETIYQHKHIDLKFQEPNAEQKKKVFLWLKEEKRKQLKIDYLMILLYILLFALCFGWFVLKIR